MSRSVSKGYVIIRFIVCVHLELDYLVNLVYLNTT